MRQSGLLWDMRSEAALYALVYAVYGADRAPRMMDVIVMRRLASNHNIDEIVTAMWPEVLRVMEAA